MHSSADSECRAAVEWLHKERPDTSDLLRTDSTATADDREIVVSFPFGHLLDVVELGTVRHESSRCRIVHIAIVRIDEQPFIRIRLLHSLQNALNVLRLNTVDANREDLLHISHQLHDLLDWRAIRNALLIPATETQPDRQIVMRLDQADQRLCLCQARNRLDGDQVVLAVQQLSSDEIDSFLVKLD